MPQQREPALPGVVLTNGVGQLACGTPTFDASGNLIAYLNCNDFAVLGH
jgi:hypothetical protein